MTARFANVLKDLGVERDDRVAVYLPMVPEAPAAMLACARIGAPHSVVFGGFSVEAVKDRPVDPKTPPDPTEDAGAAVDRAIAFWGNPTVSVTTRASLLAFAKRCDAGADKQWKKKSYPALRQNALRVLVATSPDLQTS